MRWILVFFFIQTIAVGAIKATTTKEEKVSITKATQKVQMKKWDETLGHQLCGMMVDNADDFIATDKIIVMNNFLFAPYINNFSSFFWRVPLDYELLNFYLHFFILCIHQILINYVTYFPFS